MRNFRFRNMWLVAKREYLERVKTKAFLITTLLAPALIVGLALGPTKIMMSNRTGARRIVAVAPDEQTAAAVKLKLEERASTVAGRNEEQSNLTFNVQVSTDLSDSHRHRLEKDIDDKKIDGFLWLDPDSITTHTINYVAASTTDFIEMQTLRVAVREGLMARDFEKNGIDAEKRESLLKPYQLETTQWANGHAQKGGDGQFIVVFVLGFAMYMITIVYGMNVLRAVIAEKTSRIMEVLLSSLTPSELMAGKVFGVAAVGITQVAIWMLATLIGVASPAAMMAASALKQLTPMVAVYFVLFFLFGFLLYSSMCAALGSMVNSEQEAQQFQFIIMIPLMLSFFYVFFAIRAPQDPLVVALSLFPLSSPLVMFARVILGAAPVTQILASLLILVASIAIVIWLCARIYRVGVLMYGKKPNLPEIIKWIRYA